MYIYVYICKCICSFLLFLPAISHTSTHCYFYHAYIYWLSIHTNLEPTLGLGFSKDMSVLHESKWLLDADRRLHRLGTEREHFECSLSGTAVSAPADIWQVCGLILCMCSNANENTGVCIYALIVTSNSLLLFVLRTETDIFANWHRALSSNLNRRFGWCCFHHFTRNSPVALLRALLARIFSYLSSRCTVQVSQRKTKQRKGTNAHKLHLLVYFLDNLSSALAKLFEGILSWLTKFTETHSTLTGYQFGTRPGR